jgi:hypothetical protein
MTQGLRFWTASEGVVLNHFRSYADQLIVQARAPAAALAVPPPVPDDPICEGLSPSFTRARRMDTEMRLEEMTWLLRLALHAYRLDHGGYPGRLDQLVPRYLPNLPDDPRTIRGSCGYRRDKDGRYTLYSADGLSVAPRSAPAKGRR